MKAALSSDGRKLLIEVDIEPNPVKVSSTGKSLIVAQVGWEKPEGIKVAGKQLMVNLLACIKRD